MMRIGWAALLLLTGCDGHAAPASTDAASPLQDDLVSYATASCFAIQPDKFLKEQGQQWAEAIMQGAHGPVEAWAPVAMAVKAEIARSGIAQGQGEGPAALPVPLPVMTCGRIATTPAVRRAIAAAAATLAHEYNGTPR